MNVQTKIYLLILAFVAAVGVDVRASEAIQGFSDPGPVRLMLKMDKQFIGGHLQVYSAGSALIISQKMKKRKLSIDFSEAVAGEYIVRVSNGKKQEEYHFLKK